MEDTVGELGRMRKTEEPNPIPFPRKDAGFQTRRGEMPCTALASVFRYSRFCIESCVVSVSLMQPQFMHATSLEGATEKTAFD